MQAVPTAPGDFQYYQVFVATPPTIPDWLFLLIPLIAVLAGVVAIAWKWEMSGPRRTRFERAIPYFVACMGVVMLVSMAPKLLKERPSLAQRLQRGEHQVVEGVVTNFVPMPEKGHAMESFDVDGHHYEYSTYQPTGGFNLARSHGGPLHEGVRVRIADIDGLIARLEIARPRPSSTR